MSNPGMMLTAKGREVLAKALTGKVLHFCRVSYGSGDFDYSTEKVSDLTELREWKMDLPIVGKEIEGNGIVNIKAQLSNFELLEGFPAKEVGVYCEDPDTGEVILYAYRNAGDEYSYIPAKTGPVHKNTTMGYRVEIQDSPNVTFEINSAFAYVSQNEYDAHIKAAHPHLNTPNHYDDVITTSALWATDEDNHLHKISLANVKNLLGGSDTQTEERISILENYSAAYSRLGIDTQIFIVEDFNQPLIDDLNLRVTSCAKGGNLIGLEDTEGLQVGGVYCLTDGVIRELVTLENVVNNLTGRYAKTNYVLQNDFDVSRTRLIRTNARLDGSAFFCESKSSAVQFIDRETFFGTSANVSREIIMSTRHCITEGGFVTADGFFTL